MKIASGTREALSECPYEPTAPLAPAARSMATVDGRALRAASATRPRAATRCDFATRDRHLRHVERRAELSRNPTRAPAVGRTPPSARFRRLAATGTMATKVQRIMTQPIVRQLRDRSLQSHVSTVELRADDSSSLSRVAKRPHAPHALTPPSHRFQTPLPLIPAEPDLPVPPDQGEDPDLAVRKRGRRDGGQDHRTSRLAFPEPAAAALVSPGARPSEHRSRRLFRALG